jgi:hypothetical protein
MDMAVLDVWTNHGHVNDGIQTGGDPLIRDIRVQGQNAEEHGDPVVVDMAAGRERAISKKKKKICRERKNKILENRVKMQTEWGFRSKFGGGMLWLNRTGSGVDPMPKKEGVSQKQVMRFVSENDKIRRFLVFETKTSWMAMQMTPSKARTVSAERKMRTHLAQDD